MLRFLIEKEFKQIIRNSFLPRIIVAMPLMVMLVFPWVANQEVRNINLSVVDHDRSAFSERMTNKIISSGYFRLTDVSANGNQAMNSINSGAADIILEIENSFERNIINEGTGRVMISANAVNGTKAMLGSSYLSAILAEYANEMNIESGKWKVENNFQTSNFKFQLLSQYRFNPHLDYKVFMLPALMVMLLTLLCGFLPALNIVSEKEAGTIEQINVTPVKKIMFVFAKLIPFWIIGFVVLSICMTISALVYGLFPTGSLLTILFFASIYILSISGFGLVISNYSNTMQQAMFMIFFFIMIFILMSGLFTPVSSMPQWAQTITIFNPLKYFMEVMRLIYLKGSIFGEMLPQFWALCGFGMTLNTWAVLSYRKSR